MKVSILEILRCPKCQSTFELGKVEMKNGEVFSGKIQCSSCSSKYPIVNYIPRLVDGYNYSDSWGRLWRETGASIRDSFTGMRFYGDVLHGKYSEDNLGQPGYSPFGFDWPLNMKGQRVLEVGPGTGVCTEHLAKTEATIVCVDMSNAIDTFPEDLLTNPNVHVIQGDITKGVVEREYFDRIWLFQVLQHTPVPKDTLKELRNYLKVGGEISLTSYGGVFSPWYYGVTQKLGNAKGWGIISFLTKWLVPIKYWLLKFSRALGSTFLFKAFNKVLEPIDPRNVYFRTLEGELNDWPTGQLWNATKDKNILIKHTIINTFDTITPDYTNNCKDNATMEEWLKYAGYSSFTVWGKGGVRAKAVR